MGILLVYDVTNEQSFRNIEEWMTNIEKHTMYPVDKILIGSKTDLVSQRKITTEYRGRATAGSAAGYTLPGDLARDKTGVDDAFLALTRTVLRRTRDSHPRAG
eukprot:CAMPEP_0172181904 /NCGR_PEP_ID=MMETSP1050-20130122/18090_1 /TAXON_ID=233186 /ORGANISM="Cryptomonas curvata, Strain CCAP979/52" /LENGTH=102 /DNA_ID=CAMNT_0012855265 /DNA_START=319 /DNA_END=625 /DNA_ORIENTATION=-